ncbi:hypothetical protein BD31_I0845 [Candidatus Nitrosopumilus salaria BD31]|uniref:Queuosine 5'-phosphate N-glycosylase/hydrolase n=1 Tax=Candidatus Nitrosopumilus salarius BD31 TaxID=859350 RepID=I3D203_9ARCH|nr:queuosine salvage family protein [Candidatus Nitrosopumilus salaria]EIJ65746.1 hypothetical protein BD31_I0845 [Candidatus Nitrosopumilus salaria BD31]
MTLLDDLGINVEFSPKFQVNESKVELLSSSLLELSQTHKGYDWIDDNFWLPKTESDEFVSQFFTLGNSINFKYWSKNNSELIYSSGKKSGIDARGAMYMWRCLKTCVDSGTFDILDSKKLSEITFDEFRKIFQDDSRNDVLPLLEERHRNWIDLATKLNDCWDGNMINLLHHCKNSLVEFTKSLKTFRAFDDPICKMIMVNAIMHQGRGLVTFDQPIIPGIDYQILKQLLRLGVITTNSEIENKLEHYHLLDNSDALDIRKAGLSALFEIMEKTKLPGDYIDNMIWGNRTKCEENNPICLTDETACPFHKFCDKKTRLLIPLEDTRYY